MNKMREQLQKKKKNNKGFSLVELIIVIAIMAILVGIVGTQVIPYLTRSRESKDLQIISSFSTAAVSAYSMNAESISTTTSITNSDGNTVNGVVVSFANNYVASVTSTSSDAEILANAIGELTGYKSISAVTGAMSSSNGQGITDIEIIFDFDNNTVTTQAYKNSDKVLDPVVSTL